MMPEEPLVGIERIEQRPMLARLVGTIGSLRKNRHEVQLRRDMVVRFAGIPSCPKS